MQTILAVNASKVISHLSQPLLAAGFRVCFANTLNATILHSSGPHSAIVIRFYDASKSAEDICQIRQIVPQMPLMVISPRTDLSTKVRILDLGADDYLEEPFASEELIARLRCIIRRGTARANSAGV